MKEDIGYVYILSNPALAGIVKIGHTKRTDVSIRAQELSLSTSIPLPFEIEYCWLVETPSTWEARIHARLTSCRVAKNREFFRIHTSEAKTHINRLIYGTDNPTETALLEIKGLVRLYRKFPSSFKKSDHLVEQVEAILISRDQLDNCETRR